MIWMIPAAFALLGIAGFTSSQLAPWDQVFSLVWFACIAITALTTSWRPQKRIYADQLAVGEMIRLPGHPWSARIVTRVHNINGLAHVTFHGGASRIFEANREVAVATVKSRLAWRWHYGRAAGSQLARMHRR